MRAVELEQVVLVEALDLAVGNALAVADDAPEVALSRENLCHQADNLSTRGLAGRAAR